MMISGSQTQRSGKLPGIVAVLICLLCSVLFLTEITASYLHLNSIATVSLILFVAFFGLTLLHPFLGIVVFIATVPLVSGYMVTSGIDERFYIGFSGVFLAWFGRRLLLKKSLFSPNWYCLLVDCLLIVVLSHVGLVIFRIVEFPDFSRDWLKWFCFFPLASQKDVLWQITASLIVVKGLLLFRMILVEVNSHVKWSLLKGVFLFHMITLLLFALGQIVSLLGRGVSRIRLHLPFDDIHSYGSYVGLLLLLSFSMMVLHRNHRNKRIAEHGQSLVKYVASHKRILYVAATLLFGALIFFAQSRMSWISVFMVGFVLVIVRIFIANKKYGLMLLLSGIVLVSLGSTYSDRLLEVDNYSVQRLGSILNVDNYATDKNLYYRYELWKRAQAIIAAYPLTGTGPGSFYRISQNFTTDEQRWPNFHENAHNYFLQISAEGGLPFGIIFICLVAGLVWRGLFRSHGDDVVENDDSVFVQALAVGACGYLVTMMTGHPLLLLTQQFLFWFTLAVIASYPYPQTSSRPQEGKGATRVSMLGIGLLGVFLGGLLVNILKEEPRTLPAQYGLYGQEKWPSGYYHWTAGKAAFPLAHDLDNVTINVRTQPFNTSGPDGLQLKIFLNDDLVESVPFHDGEQKTLSYSLKSYNHKPVQLSLEMDRVFSPRQLHLSNDSRKLGVAINYY